MSRGPIPVARWASPSSLKAIVLNCRLSLRWSTIPQYWNITISTPRTKAVRVNGHGFRACNYAPNGITETAAKWVHAIEAATSRHDLQYLTLLPLRYMVPAHLFRRRRAWCALCFEQWRSEEQIVYEPLIWSIKMSAICQFHARPLDDTCCHCSGTQSPLGVFSRPGFCERCDGWLGLSDTERRRLPDTPVEEGHDAWSTMQVADLLTMLPLIEPIEARSALRISLAALLDQLTTDNVVTLAGYTHCPPSVLRKWLDGATVPTLENLLRTCRSLHIPITSLLASSGPSPADVNAAKEAIARAGSRGVALCQKKSEVRQALEKAFHDAVPHSLSDVARRMGYANTERLYQADRDLSHKIAARYRRSGRSHWWRRPGATRICETRRIKELLEQSLELAEPVSVYQISTDLGYSNDAYIRQKFLSLCQAISKRISIVKQGRPEKRLGVTLWFMGKYFPSVRHMIAEKRRRMALEGTKRRRKELFQNTYTIAVNLQTRGEYPSVNRIREALPEGSCTEWKTLSLAAHAARQALGISR